MARLTNAQWRVINRIYLFEPPAGGVHRPLASRVLRLANAEREDVARLEDLRLVSLYIGSTLIPMNDIEKAFGTGGIVGGELRHIKISLTAPGRACVCNDPFNQVIWVLARADRREQPIRQVRSEAGVDNDTLVQMESRNMIHMRDDHELSTVRRLPADTMVRLLPAGAERYPFD